MNRKSKPRYLGPYQVCRQSRNGAYILQELDGSVLRQKVAAFRIIPYISRQDQALLRELGREEREDEEEDDEEL